MAISQLSPSRAYASSASKARSGDAYIDFDEAAARWTIGTASIKKVVTLQSGVFRMLSLVFLPTKNDMVAGATDSHEFSFVLNGGTVGGGTGGWTLTAQSSKKLANGALALTIVLARPGIEVTREYVVYPHTAVISEVTSVKNTGSSSATLTTPSLISQKLVKERIAATELSYMTGGGNFSGSGILKTVSLDSSYARTFDSRDAPEVITVDGQKSSGVGSNNNGTAIYDTFFAVRDRGTADGLWVTFDYNGRWAAPIAVAQDELGLEVRAQLQSMAIASGRAVQLPKATYGLVKGDIDDLGNAIGDYTYRYLWDYTRKIIIGATWQWRASPQIPNAFASTNFGRYIGTELVHVDANWYDRLGDWQPALAGDDLAGLSDYVQKNGMQLKVWQPFWHVDYGSKVVKDHPEWLVGGDSLTYYGLHLNLANAGALDWALSTAKQQQASWNGYRWRYDGMPSWPSNGSANDLLGQSAGFLALLKGVKDADPRATIDGCASGGETLLMEAVRYSDSQQLTDGAARHYAGYYQSLKLPIDKLGHSFTSEPLDKDFSSDTTKSAQVAENTRKYTDLQRYLRAQGLIGRWAKVFRPTLESGDETYMLQRTNRDRTKSFISFSGWTPYFGKPVKIFPKGLVPTLVYSARLFKTPSFRQTATGAEWMKNGLSIADLARGEIVLFNLGGYPGSGTQTRPPAPPRNATKKAATYLGRSGTEITWTLPHQTVWVSYVEIERNGVAIDKVSVGSFWFSPDVAAGDTYRIRSVTGDGAASRWVTVNLASGSSTRKTAQAAVATSFQLSKDFTLTQGQNNWAYLQRDLRHAGNQIYITNMHADSANNGWVGEEPLTQIRPGMLSPNSPHDVVVKWFAPTTGKVRITGTVSLAQSGQGDGIKAAIFRGGSVPVLIGEYLWGWVTLPGADTAGVSHDITVPVKAYEPLYFVINQSQSSGGDLANWDPEITYV